MDEFRRFSLHSPIFGKYETDRDSRPACRSTGHRVANIEGKQTVKRGLRAQLKRGDIFGPVSVAEARAHTPYSVVMEVRCSALSPSGDFWVGSAARTVERARRAEWPWIIDMVIYTMSSLWLLAQPLVKGGKR